MSQSKAVTLKSPRIRSAKSSPTTGRPTSQWIAWGRPEENDQPKVYLYSLASKKPIAGYGRMVWFGPRRLQRRRQISPASSSSRDFKPTFGEQEFRNVYVDMQRDLSRDARQRHRITARSAQRRSRQERQEKDKDKSDGKEDEKKDDGKKDEKSKNEPVDPVKVDLDGIQDRIVGLEIPRRATTRTFALVDDRVFYLRRTWETTRGDDDEDGAGEPKWHLCSYSLEDRKETVLGDVNSYQISFDGKKMLVKIDKDYSIIDLPKDKLETKDHKLESKGARHDGRSPCGMEADLQRSAGGKCATSSTPRT